MIREAIAAMPTEFGHFQAYGYRHRLDGSEAIAMVKGDPSQFTQHSLLVRIYSECLTADALGSRRCDCRQQLQRALKLIESEGQGIVVYLRQEGRGIGLINKLKAYSLQDQGLDTVTANQQLGFQRDLRSYAVAAQILQDLGAKNLRLLTNNPDKVLDLKAWGLNIIESVSLADFSE